MKPDAILIDIDGTLLDSNDAHARTWVEVLQRHGHAVPYDRVRSLIGKGGDKLLEEAVGLDDEEGEGKTIADERRALFMERELPHLQPTRGARALLEHWKDDGRQLVIATSASGDELDALLRQAGVDDLIDHASSSKDADGSKPDPDIVVVALRKAGVAAGQALMLGDTPYDVESARKAGVDTIALRCGGFWDDDALRGAVEIYDDPAALLDALATADRERKVDASRDQSGVT